MLTSRPMMCTSLRTSSAHELTHKHFRNESPLRGRLAQMNGGTRVRALRFLGHPSEPRPMLFARGHFLRHHTIRLKTYIQEIVPWQCLQSRQGVTLLLGGR